MTFKVRPLNEMTPIIMKAVEEDRMERHIEELRQQNAELLEVLRYFLARENRDFWMYSRNKAEALAKDTLSTELFNDLQSNRG